MSAPHHAQPPAAAESRLKLACRLDLLPGASVRDQAAWARRFGFDAVCLSGRRLARYRPELARWRRPPPLPIVALSLGFDGSLVSPRAAERRACRASLEALFALCAAWGIRYVNMPPLLRQDHDPKGLVPGGGAAGADRERDARLLGELPPVLDAAARRGVCLLLEPVNRYESAYLNTVAHAARLCRAAAHPHLGVTADFFHMQIEELDIPRALRAAGPFRKLVHVAENTRVEPGPGSMDFAPGFRALKRMGFAGYIEIESRALSGPAARALPASVRYLRTQWRRA